MADRDMFSILIVLGDHTALVIKTVQSLSKEMAETERLLFLTMTSLIDPGTDQSGVWAAGLETAEY